MIAYYRRGSWFVFGVFAFFSGLIYPSTLCPVNYPCPTLYPSALGAVGKKDVEKNKVGGGWGFEVGGTMAREKGSVAYGVVCWCMVWCVKKRKRGKWVDMALYPCPVYQNYQNYQKDRVTIQCCFYPPLVSPTWSVSHSVHLIDLPRTFGLSSLSSCSLYVMHLFNRSSKSSQTFPK